MLLSVVALTAALVTSFAEGHAQTSTFNPGIHPATPASIAAEQVAENAWFAHVKFLASDELKGRKTGTPEFLEAAAYVEEQFKAIGLKHAGVEGYRQPIGFRSVLVDVDHSSFELIQTNVATHALKIGSEATLSPNQEGSV